MKGSVIEPLSEARGYQRELARRHLLDFICYSDATYDPARHHKIVAEVLERVEADVWAIKSGQPLDHDPLNRVMISMPPRHGKSREASVEFPAWVLGRHPDLSVMVTSYSADLAYDFSRLARNRLADVGVELWNMKVSSDSAAVAKWGIARHPFGGMVAAGVGGPITGRGAHIAIIDDPHKNWQEAASKTMRDNVYSWYQSTLRTRLAPGAAIVVIQTRWHEDDLSGRLLKAQKEAEAEIIGRYLEECGGDFDAARVLAQADPEWDTIERWTVINIPAYCTSEEEAAADPLGRGINEAIWPKMYPMKYLLQTARALGSYLFNALYQGKPRPSDGTIFKREHFRYFEVVEDVLVLYREDNVVERFTKGQCFIIQTCDPAASEKKSADYFVMSTWIVTPKADLLLIDVLRTRLEGPDQPILFTNAQLRWSPVAQGVEKAGLGITLFQNLRMKGLPVVELKTETDKVVRAIPMSARIEAHSVFWLAGAPWLEAWEEELLAFPKGQYDDQVDTGSNAAIMLSEIIQANTGNQMAVYDDPVRISPI